MLGRAESSIQMKQQALAERAAIQDFLKDHSAASRAMKDRFLATSLFVLWDALNVSMSEKLFG